MGKRLAIWLTALMMTASTAFAAVVEDWSGVQPGTNTGSFQDSNGSKIDFTTDAGPAGGKALKLTTNLAAGGYVGIWHNIAADLSKSGSLKFQAKSSVPGDVQIALKDAYNVQYVAKFSIPSSSWTTIEVPLSSFAKDPYYTPPDAIAGHPMDLSKTSGINFQPQIAGAAVIEIGAIETSGAAGASSASSASSSTASSSSSSTAASSSGPSSAVLDCTGIANDGKNAGTFQDSQGSSFTFKTVDNPSKKGTQYLSITYDLKQGGYCGMWCRAGGSDWNGSNLSSAKTLTLVIYSKDPVILGLALKDKNNNQYVADTPSTKGGKWETVTVPMDSFHLDPYYTPPDAVKGAPKDFSKVATFNIQPKTVGKVTVAISSMTAQ